MKSKLLLVVPVILAIGMLLPNPSAQAQTFVVNLDGPSEAPPNASPGTGFATITIDLALHTLQIDVTFSGLLGTVTASHIHAATAVPGTGTAGVATQTPTFMGFPSGVTFGTYSHLFDTLDAATYNPAYITANGGTPATAEAALAAAFANGTAYLNIHSSVFGGGEIRGFLAVPEPATIGLLAVGAAGFLLLRRRRA